LRQKTAFTSLKERFKKRVGLLQRESKRTKLQSYAKQKFKHLDHYDSPHCAFDCNLSYMDWHCRRNSWWNYRNLRSDLWCCDGAIRCCARRHHGFIRLVVQLEFPWTLCFLEHKHPHHLCNYTSVRSAFKKTKLNATKQDACYID
jgi:hypothetical protein